MEWKANMTEEKKAKWLMEVQDEGTDERAYILLQWEKKHMEELEKLSEIDQLKISTVICKTKLSLEELDRMTVEALLALYK